MSRTLQRARRPASATIGPIFIKLGRAPTTAEIWILMRMALILPACALTSRCLTLQEEFASREYTSSAPPRGKLEAEAASVEATTDFRVSSVPSADRRPRPAPSSRRSGFPHPPRRVDQ